MPSNRGAFILDMRTQMWIDCKCAEYFSLAYPDDTIVAVAVEGTVDPFLSQ